VTVIGGWIELLRSLGESLLGVAEAEAAALKGDLRASGKQLLLVCVLAGAAVFLFFWVVGAASFVLFQVLSIWLPRWGAAAIVLIVLLLLAGILTLLARQKLRAIEPPVDTVRRHYDDHRAWWQSQVLVDNGPEAEQLTEESRTETKGSLDKS